MSIGQNIKEARKKAGITQAELANAVGLSTITIRQYESDKREPRYHIINKIAKVLDCDISKLVDSKKEAQMILNTLIGEEDDQEQRFFSSSKKDDGELIDTLTERKKQGSIVQQYTEFISTHALLMQLIKEIGFEFDLTNPGKWDMVTIHYEEQKITSSISSLISDLEVLMWRYKQETKRLFKEHYSFTFHSEDEED